MRRITANDNIIIDLIYAKLGFNKNEQQLMVQNPIVDDNENERCRITTTYLVITVSSVGSL
jgi:hypothetical protein